MKAIKLEKTLLNCVCFVCFFCLEYKLNDFIKQD